MTYGFTRRGVIVVSGLAASTTFASTSDATKYKRAPISLESPADAVVTFIAGEGPVSKGVTVLFTLICHELLLFKSQMKFVAEQLDIAERVFSDHRIDDEIALLKSKYDAVAATDKIHQANLKLANAQIKFGTRQSEITLHSNSGMLIFPVHAISLSTNSSASNSGSFSHSDPVSGVTTQQSGSQTSGSALSTSDGYAANPDYQNIDTLKINAATSASLLAEAKLTFEQASAKRNDAYDRIATAKQRIQEQMGVIADWEKSLTMISPIDGTFIPHALQGAALRKGHSLGTVEQA